MLHDSLPRSVWKKGKTSREENLVASTWRDGCAPSQVNGAERVHTVLIGGSPDLAAASPSFDSIRVRMLADARIHVAVITTTAAALRYPNAGAVVGLRAPDAVLQVLHAVPYAYQHREARARDQAVDPILKRLRDVRVIRILARNREPCPHT